MKLYKLSHSTYKNDLHFGLPDIMQITTEEKKLQHGFENIKPWMYFIPFYKDSHIAFLSKDALLTFLYGICDLSKEEIIKLDDMGYYIELIDTSIVDTGFSKIICSYKEDEMNKDPENMKLKNITRKKEYNKVEYIASLINTPDIKNIRNTYYKNIKTNF